MQEEVHFGRNGPIKPMRILKKNKIIRSLFINVLNLNRSNGTLVEKLISKEKQLAGNQSA